MKLTQEYLEAIKDKLVRKPLLWIDSDWSIDIDWTQVQGQDTGGRLEIWVYIDNAAISQIDNVEQLEAMYFGVFGKNIYT